AREIGRTVRHSSQCKVTDPDLRDIFTILTSLLSDSKCLSHDVTAQEALRKLAELERDTLRITTEEMIHLLEAAQDTLKTVEHFADKALDEMKMHLEQCRKDLNTHTDKCKQELDEHTEKCTNAIDEHVSKTVESTYDQSCKELIERTKKLYRDTLNHVPISPLNDYKHEKLGDVYMPPKIVKMSEDKGVFKKTDEQVTQYNGVFLTDDKVNRRIFLQGEAGSGKTTFLSKLALDWCGEPHDISASDNSSLFFSDIDVLQSFVFVFHITLRNSVKQFDVYTLIKQQIIDSIYSQEDREKAYKLVNEIMKREQCLILLDGLDEWTGPGDHHNLPELVVDHSECVMLFSTRPWKLAVVKITHLDRYTSVQLEGVNKPFELSRLILGCLVAKDDLELKCSAFKHYIAKQKLDNLLSSPMMLSAIVCSFAEGIELKGSKCEIYILLLESLFKKANSEMRTFEQPPFSCFTETQYIQPNIDTLNRLAELAFHLLFVNTKENSLVFSISELRQFKLDEQEQMKFALQSGILSSARKAALLRPSSSFSFIHLSMQEFLAAYHISRNPDLVDGVISVYLNRQREAYRDISQVFIFLCGLDVTCAEKLSSMMDERNCHALSSYGWLNLFDFQTIILAGHREAVANGHNETFLRLSTFIFDQRTYVNDLHRIWTNNAANVISLEIGTKKYTFENKLMSPANDKSASHIKNDLSLCPKLKRLVLCGGVQRDGILLKDSASVTSLEFPVWIVQISTDPSQCTTLPSIEYIELHEVKCSYTLLCSLLSSLLTLDHQVTFKLISCEITSCVKGAVSTLFNIGHVKIKTENKKIAVSVDFILLEALNGLNINSLSRDDRCKAFRENHKESLSQTLVLLSHLDKLRIVVYVDTHVQWKTLHGLNIKSLSLNLIRVNHSESLSQSLASLKQLEMLSIEVDNGNRALWQALHGLGIKSLSLSGFWHYKNMLSGLIVKNAKSLKQSLLSLKQLETLNVCVYEDTPGLWEALQGLSIKSLSLSCPSHTSNFKLSLVSLKQLDTLSVSVIYHSLGLWEALQGMSIKNLSLNLSRDRIDSCKLGQDLNDSNPDFRLKYATSLKQSILSLKELETLSISVDYDIPGLWEALHSLSIKSLRGFMTSGFKTKYVESLEQWLSSLTQLDTLSISVDRTNPDLWEALHGLSIKSLSMSLGSNFVDFNLNYAESIKKSLLSLTQLDTLSIIAKTDNPGLCETLNGLNIKRLSLSGEKRGLRVDHAESLSQWLLSLTQLETLTLHLNTYIALQVPRSLKYLNIYSKKLLPSELRDLVGRLAACPHAIDIELEIGCASSIDPPERILLQEYILVQQELFSRPNVVVKKFRTYESESNSTMPVHYIGGVDNPAHCDLSIKDYAYDIFAKLMERFKYSRISIGLQINPDSFL
ncbi:hypothetical protein DPMN_171730, partial [Dreissena polymorpha]